MFKTKHNNCFTSSFFRTLKKGEGFTLVEILLVIAVLIILLTMSVVALKPFQNQSDLQGNSQEIISVLRRAQNRTLASDNDSTFGVFINTISNPHQYILFQEYTCRMPVYSVLHVAAMK